MKKTLNIVLTMIFFNGILINYISADSFTGTTIIQADKAHQEQEELTLDSPKRLKELTNQIKGVQNLLINKYNYTQNIAQKIITKDLIINICSRLYNGGFCEGDTAEDILFMGEEEINRLLITETNTKIELPEEDEDTSTNESPIKIGFESKTFGNGGIYITSNYMTVTSLVDSLSIDNIIINKGNCSISKKSSSIDNLKYGEFKKISLPSKCRVLKVEIETNKGSWIFSKD